MTAKQLSATMIVVLLTDMTVQGDLVPVNSVCEVERSIRNDWKGSGLCRDATEEEIAEYRGQEQAADGFDEGLQDRKRELLGDLEALESDLEEFGKQRAALQAELEGLVEQRDTLAGEVKALEKSKAAAAKK